jgi:ribosome biogenesis GTPase
MGKPSGRLRKELKTEEDSLCVGDWVIAKAHEGDGQTLITKRLPRKSCLMRKEAGTTLKAQLMASNVDTVCICTSANRDMNLSRIERFETIACGSGADVLIVITKSDLVQAPRELVEGLQKRFPSTCVIPVNNSENGYDALRESMRKGRTYAFIGASGVGKSTLINALVGQAVMQTKEIREDDKGRHTTTHREILYTPSGVLLVDMPGVREIQLIDDFKGLDHAFSDIQDLAGACKYSNCRHETEPGCAVLNAIEAGQLDASRLQNYKKMHREMDAYWKKKGKDRYKSKRRRR